MNFKRKLMSACMAAALFAFASTTQAATLVLVAAGDTTLSSADVTVGLNTTTSFELWMVGAPAAVAGAQWDFTYDPTNVSLVSGANGVPFVNTTTGMALNGGVDAGTGSVVGTNFVYLVGDMGPAGNYKLATIDVVATANGSSLLTLLNPVSRNIDPATGLTQTFPLNLAAATAKITVVPIPAAIWLLGSGLVGLLGFGRLRRNAASSPTAVAA